MSTEAAALQEAGSKRSNETTRQWWLNEFEQRRQEVAELQAYVEQHRPELEEVTNRFRVPLSWPELELEHHVQALANRQELYHSLGDNLDKYYFPCPVYQLVKPYAKAFWIHHAPEFGAKPEWFDYAVFCGLVSPDSFDKTGTEFFSSESLMETLYRYRVSRRWDRAMTLAQVREMTGSGLRFLRERIKEGELKAETTPKGLVVKLRDLMDARICQPLMYR